MRKRFFILPAIFIVGAILIGRNMTFVNVKAQEGNPQPTSSNPQPSDCQYCQQYGCCADGSYDPGNCNLGCGTDPSCGEWCDGSQNERGHLSCTGLNVQGQPAPGVTVKLTCSADYKYVEPCDPRAGHPYALFYMSTDNGANWSPIIEPYNRNIYARRLKAFEAYDYTIPATAASNISFKCETYIHKYGNHNGDKKCWVEQPNNQSFYVSAHKASAPVCQQSFTPTKLNFKCDNLVRDVYEPQPGSVVRYTCTADGTGYNSADFRVTVNGTVPADPNATVQIPQGQTSAAYDYTVPADAITVTADCRVCNDAATRVCTEWGVSNISKTIYQY